MRLIFIPEYFIKQHPRPQVLFNILRSKMAKECGLGSFIYKATKTDKIGQMKMGFLVLTDGTNLLCAAYMAYCRIVARYTPPSYRKKGYATELLRRAEEMFSAYEDMPLWVVSYERTINSNLRAGWVKVCDVDTTNINNEPEFSYTPPSKLNLVEKIQNMESADGFVEVPFWESWVKMTTSQQPLWNTFLTIKMNL